MALSDSFRNVGRRMLGRPVPAKAVYKDKFLTRVSSKASRQKLARGIQAGVQPRNGIWMPMVRPEALVSLTDIVWIVGSAVDRIVEEVTKGGWEFVAKFGAKCTVCGAEYDSEPDECDTLGCMGHEFTEADTDQLEEVESVMERPNWDRTGRVVKTFKDLLKDATYYNQVIDSWHWEIVYDVEGRPRQVWPMNSEFLRRFEDPSLTVGEFFCPICHFSKGAKECTYYGVKECPLHPGQELLQVEWAQLDEDDNIVRIWAAMEVLDGTARARGYRVYGRSKVLRCWAMAQIIRWMEMHQWGTYSGNNPPDTLVTVTGMDQSELNNMIDEHEKFKAANPEYPEVIYLALPGTPDNPTGLEVHHLMGTMVDLDAVALMEKYTEAVAINLGVSMTMMGVQEAGKLGHPEEVLQVSYDTIEEVQSQLEEFVNGKFLPLFEGIEDWEFKLNPPAPADEQKKAEEFTAWLDATTAAQSAGYKEARLDPKVDFDVPIELGPFTEPEEEMPFGEEGMMPPGPGGEPPPKEGESPAPEAGPPDVGVFTEMKRWRRYRGPGGGTGWQDTTNPSDIRYQEEMPKEGEGKEEGEPAGPAPGEPQAPEPELLDLDVAPTVDNYDRWVEQAAKDPGIIKAREQIAAGEYTHVIHGDPTRESGYTEEREKVHAEIVESMLNPAAAVPIGTRPVAVMLMGQPASGKTSALKPMVKASGLEYTTLAADHAKKMLPEYEGWNAALLHQESQDVAQHELTKRAIQGRHNVIVDWTAANMQKTQAHYQNLCDHGYDVHLVYVDVSVATSAKRVLQRYKEAGRYVPLSYLQSIDKKPLKSYNELKEMDCTKQWSHHSTENTVVGQDPELIEEGSR